MPPPPLLLLLAAAAACRGEGVVRRRIDSELDFRLDCPRDSLLAFHGALFSGDDGCEEDIRPTLNRRCSGVSHCHYNLTEDHPERKCSCRGSIELQYDCVPEREVLRSCGARAGAPRGYLASPGYPHFHPGARECAWRLEASAGGRPLRVSLLDLELGCPDRLEVSEGAHRRRRWCGSDPLPRHDAVLETTGGPVRLGFEARGFGPERGFLVHYTQSGCPEVRAPRLGYVVHADPASALLLCCKGHVFNGSFERSRALRCVDGIRWNDTVSPCLAVAEARRLGANATLGDDDDDGLGADVVGVYLGDRKYIEEVLIPVASVVGLVFGNLALVLAIRRIRRKRKGCPPPPPPPQEAPRVRITDL